MKTKIYFGEVLLPCYGDVLAEFRKKSDELEKLLRSGGFEVLNFTSPCLPFNPCAMECSIREFVRHADVVIARDAHPVIGFDDTVLEASQTFWKPRVLLSSSDVNVFTRKPVTPLYLRCRFKDPEFVVETLRKFF